MKQTVTAICQYLAATLFVALCLSAFGCSDTASVSDEPQVPLSSLGVTPGKLQPAFSSNVTSYTFRVSAATASVTVTARPKDSKATITINGNLTSAGQGRIVTLGPPGSTTTISINLTTQTGGETTYSVDVIRPLSSDNNLSALTVTPGPLAPAFDPATLNYTVNVATSVTQVSVSATKSDPIAVMSGSVTAGAGVATGQATIPLDAPGTSKQVSITVTAPNGAAKTYTITVNRLSGDNNLSALTITPGALDPAFAPATLNYSVDVATNVTAVTVTATKSDPNAVLSGDVPNQGQATIPLDGPGTSKLVSITVTAPNGNSKTYTVTVNRAAPSSDNNLSALTITPSNLDPTFASSTLNYMVDVATNVTAVTVTATKSDPNAVLSGDVPNQGQATIPLDGPGTSKLVSIIVTAPNGNSKTYAVTVNRAALASDNNLSALTVTPGTLVPDFAQSTTTYSVEVPLSVDNVIVSATKSDPNAVMSGDVTAGAGVATGQQSFLLVPLLPVTVSITVTAPNGDSKLYSVVIIRTLF
ncbi:MAG: cadherin-like beta sandwich domain-containing protein [Nitrospira sp. BO4]|nr:cadherin-like beta sandwich domain-containing protein [Nitrospira sp. BO4]